MIIEIVTTKKKLNKSLINQMPIAKIEQFRNGLVLGHLIGIKKQSYLTGLIELNEEYYCFATDWKKGNSRIYRTIGRWATSIDFDNDQERNDWWKCYKNAKEIAIKTHIYI